MSVQQSAPFSDVLSQAATLWGLKDGIALLRDGQNHVYAGRLASGREVIVRITDDRHRSAALIGGELSWLAFLSARGCAVSEPIPASDGALVKTFTADGRPVHVVCFTRLDGSPVDVNDPGQWTPDLFENLGRELGRIHALSQAYDPEPGLRRYAWYEETEFRRLADFRGKVPDDVLGAIEALIASLKARSTETGTFGLIHSDIYADNLLYRDGQVQLFDFDQACYGWYVYDLICPLYPHYISPAVKIPGATTQDAVAFFRYLVAGYRETHVLTEEQLDLAADLLRLKEIFVYLIIVEQFDQWVTTLGVTRERLREMVRVIEARVTAGAPIIDIDFTRF